MDCSVTACLVFEGDLLNHVRRHHRHKELSVLISVLWSKIIRPPLVSPLGNQTSMGPKLRPYPDPLFSATLKQLCGACELGQPVIQSHVQATEVSSNSPVEEEFALLFAV